MYLVGMCVCVCVCVCVYIYIYIYMLEYLTLYFSRSVYSCVCYLHCCFVSGVQECSHTTSGSVLWKRHKVPQTDNLTCKDCNFITSSRSLLEVHSRRHTGIKPYVCPDCGKAFPQSSGLSKTSVFCVSVA